jgi:hypothetical protein
MIMHIEKREREKVQYQGTHIILNTCMQYRAPPGPPYPKGVERTTLVGTIYRKL